MKSPMPPSAQKSPSIPTRYLVVFAFFISTKVMALVSVAIWLTVPAAGCNKTGGVPLRVVEQVDLNRYAGVWYEYASIPNPFQKGCFDTRATYIVRENQELEVINSCRRKSHAAPRSEARGRAWIPDLKTPAKLRVRFFWPFSGDYWVLGLAPDYSWAVIGQPSRRYGWVLSRTPHLADQGQREAREVIERSGYVYSRFLLTPQKVVPDDS